MIVIKLKRRTTTPSSECTEMGEDVFFPFERPEYGLFDLVGAQK